MTYNRGLCKAHSSVGTVIRAGGEAGAFKMTTDRKGVREKERVAK